MEKKTTGEKLQELGLDVRFLKWLEGANDRLPRLHAVYKLTGEELAGAVTAAAWLRQLSFQPKLIAPVSPAEWEDRYKLLEDFLQATLTWRMTSRILQMNSDLKSLDHVLDTVLPTSAWEKYKKDILDLGMRHQPPEIPKGSARRRGGKDESEETGRMRAAIAYVSTVSKSPFLHLAECWNEIRVEAEYYPDAIKSRLRKGHYLNRTEATAERLLEHWKDIYNLELRHVFPGPFPHSQELKELLKLRKGQ